MNPNKVHCPNCEIESFILRFEYLYTKYSEAERKIQCCEIVIRLLKYVC